MADGRGSWWGQDSTRFLLLFFKKAVLPYCLAAALGLAAGCAMLTLPTLTGAGGLWALPGGDPAYGLTGHLAFQAPGWHWPLLRAPDLFWPIGRSVAMTDSNPLMSLLAKLISSVLGHKVNLLGVWLALCWTLQPVAALYALRGFPGSSRGRINGLAAGVCAAGICLLCPAWLLRRHINLLGHFILLAAIGRALRMMRAGCRPAWWRVCLLLCGAILVHPYLFVLSAAIFSAPVLRDWIARRPERRWTRSAYAACCLIPVGLLSLLSGGLGGSASGFGFYSMNLISPIWPQISGIFGASLPVIDATGGQYEGFNYLGAGALLLLAAAALSLWRRPLAAPFTRPTMLALLIPLAALTLMALTPRVYAGSWLIVPTPRQPWEKIFGMIQASGRAFWVVGYSAVLGSIALLAARMARRPFAALVAIALTLQWIDTAPMRAKAHEFLSGRHQHPAPLAIPAGARLLRIVPACDPDNTASDPLRLAAIRRGLHLADMRLARPTPGFDCEDALSDGLETGLEAGELRFFLPSAVPLYRQAALGRGATCVSLAQGVACAAGLPLPPGIGPAPPGSALPILPAASAELSGAALRPYLAFGWHAEAEGRFWSEGPRATLLFAAIGADRTVTLDLDAVARRDGGTRDIAITAGGSVTQLVLRDGVRVKLRLRLGVDPEGANRIVFDLHKPVDPQTRRLHAPVGRAAIRLYGLSVP